LSKGWDFYEKENSSHTRNFMMRLTHWPFVAMAGLIPFHASAQTALTQEATESAVRTAYERLENQITADDEKAALEQWQRAWIKAGDEECPDRRAPCRVQRNLEWRYFLEGRTVDGMSPPSAIRPFFTRQTGAEDVEISATRMKFTNPKTFAEFALNEFMDRQLQEALDRAHSVNPPSKEEQYYSSMTSELNFVSPKLLSARVDGDYFVGQAHPDPWGESINIDMSTGKILGFDDLLDTTGAKKVFAYCHKQIGAQKMEKLDDEAGGNVTLEEISERTSDLGSWAFKNGEALVNYGVYAFGGYGQGDRTCDIPYSVLRPLAKKTFPLPAQKLASFPRFR
jgi:hypothetical protein